ncbi:uncharacterized protein LOC132745277 [Ruditapes philippinarum]|uniref:uncharacterized protein LOC132745277 n=1 Tax=Ruditapes philippinarum TaxID=129788 RepID=UPI00295A6C5C|nr:uncharacterized protein LOC132745277 [Ruditapes philippinarum]
MIRGMEQHPAMQGSELLKQITILDAIYLLSNSWSEVEGSTIVKCFLKAGFSFDCDYTNSSGSALSVTGVDANDDEDDDDDVPLAVMQMSHELFGCDYEDLIRIDEELLTCEIQNSNWDAPIETLLSQFMPENCAFSAGIDGDDDDSDDNDNDSSVNVPTYSEACDYFNKLKTFAVSLGNQTLVDNIVKFDDELCNEILNKPKQTQITDFFEKRTV